ncbi:MAG: VWA domain-containing protein [Actinomycetota bacterium]
MGGRHRYSRWDGTQAVPALAGQDVLDAVADDLLYHGDVNAALRRLLQGGFEHDGRHVQGLRDLLERLRERRRSTLERYDLGGVYEEIARELRDIVDEERLAVDDAERQARASGDSRRRENGEAAAAERRLELDLLPADLAGQVDALRRYQFTSAPAEARFERLLDRLRRQLLASRFNEMAGAMQAMSAEDMARFKDMLAALNRMLDQRARGEEPDFEAFMDRYGDFFPGHPRSLDELLEQMARQMAAMQSLLGSMSPEQRAQLQALSDQLLDDVDLRWQVDQLGRNLQAAFPQMGWGQGYGFEGDDPLSMTEAAALMGELSRLDQLENLLVNAATPAQLSEVDLDAARALLGADAAADLDRLAALGRALEEAGLVARKEGRSELTPHGMRRLGQKALADLFAGLAPDRFGGHAVDRAGAGHEATYETKPYEYGDRFELDIERTVRNAVARAGPGVPVGLRPEDFEVARTEALTRTSTVLLLDLSLSMPMGDNFLAAKKTAMALHALISSRFPQDYLGLVVFSEVARELRPQDLPEVSWDFVYGTNVQHALQLARRMLAHRGGTRQVLLVTDGEPTAHTRPGGDVFFHYPPARQTLEATMAEVLRCTAEGIRINTFLLDATERLEAFVRQVAAVNRGRVFVTTPGSLGSYVLLDFLDNRPTLRRRPAS